MLELGNVDKDIAVNTYTVEEYNVFDASEVYLTELDIITNNKDIFILILRGSINLIIVSSINNKAI